MRNNVVDRQFYFSCVPPRFPGSERLKKPRPWIMPMADPGARLGFNAQTPDAIPLKVFSYTDSKVKAGQPVTLLENDLVDVIEQKEVGGHRTYRFRTRAGTYGWLLGFSLKNQAGQRLDPSPP